MNDNDFHDWLKGWREISEYLGRSRRTVMRWEKSGGLPVMRDVAGRPIASRLHIDRWIIDMNLEMFEMGRWKHPGVKAAIACEMEREQERKELQERFIAAQRPPRSRF